MRPTFRPPPSREELATLPMHVLIRDYPETLAVLRRTGIDTASYGDQSAREAERVASGLLTALGEVTAWRSVPDRRS